MATGERQRANDEYHPSEHDIPFAFRLLPFLLSLFFLSLSVFAQETAVDLVKKVIDRQNIYIENQDYYQYRQYEKRFLTISELKPEVQDHRATRQLQFLYKHLDTTRISAEQPLSISLRETISEEYRRKKNHGKNSHIIALRNEGLGKQFESETVDAVWYEAVKQINIFDNQINLLLKRFVSPLSSRYYYLFYEYYFDNEQLNDSFLTVRFRPKNDRDLGFEGYMQIDTSSFALHRIELRTPHNINLDFITQLSIIQDYDMMPDSIWRKKHEVIDVEISLFKMHYGFYIKNERYFENYVVNLETSQEFGFNDVVTVEKNARQLSDSVWRQLRFVPLTQDEQNIRKLIGNFDQMSYYKILSYGTQLLVDNYMMTGKTKATSKFDVGPVFSTLSKNAVQGWRIRLGGRTTANLNDRLFLKGYAAYGIKDKQWMYEATVVYSFFDKLYHDNEYRKNAVNARYHYDIRTPGQEYYYVDPDNIFLSFKRGNNDKMTYLRKSEIWYEKEYANGFYWKLSALSWNEEATGSLKFETENELGTLKNIGNYNATACNLMLRWALNEKFYQGRDARIILKRDGPVFAFSQSLGLKNVLGGEYSFYQAELYAQKRFWLPGYGHFNVIGKTGKIWGTLPYPLLILPNANQTYTIQPESYSMMNTLEFINDRYVSADVTYYLDGWLFNRIPYINNLKLREIISFKSLWGALYSHNDPAYNRSLFLFPENSYQMTTTPYMEFSIGIDNIFKFLRIDYVRRLSYLNDADIAKNGVRVNVSLSF